MGEWITTTMQYKNATLIIRRPVLTEEERKKREAAIIHVLSTLPPIKPKESKI